MPIPKSRKGYNMRQTREMVLLLVLVFYVLLVLLLIAMMAGW
ncbi:hypothetical protein [Paenibacillus nasutitermitis]|uniref:Uncharacterized protein n=1 Tax=Paenibacillus nasutitermitis TaxID=1652958 RepID=A0A916Z208_9BACL|nr:hypothetical protein [Paenibacillus nasutitermitis]GGD71928.1 hypothetical protein GCM10010911_32330 [Paenibacillus nasutitermitis]